MTFAVGVLGLGEAGSAIAAGLVAAGCDVRGWDPVAQPDGIPFTRSARDAALGAEVVLSVNAAAAALDAARSVTSVLQPGQLYADLNTTAPSLKQELADVVLPADFADVALLGPVPGSGLATPALASGPGAERFAELVGPLGMPIEIVGARAGEAAGRKLVRSVFMKGIAAAAGESLEAGRAAGVEDWLRPEISAVLGEPLLDRLLVGSEKHAVRRIDEMEAAAAYLRELGVEPRIAEAAAGWLAQLAPRR
jgi:3-hydroxyisobutyrate dehydrogenase-like beta-hydroxyacid dehydrogenase